MTVTVSKQAKRPDDVTSFVTYVAAVDTVAVTAAVSHHQLVISSNSTSSLLSCPFRLFRFSFFNNENFRITIQIFPYIPSSVDGIHFPVLYLLRPDR